MIAHGRLDTFREHDRHPGGKKGRREVDSVTEYKTMVRITRTVIATRGLLRDWAQSDDPSEMRGWETMTIEELHEICDPNMAFHDAAISVNALPEGLDTVDAIPMLNAAMGMYNAFVTDYVRTRA